MICGHLRVTMAVLIASFHVAGCTNAFDVQVQRKDECTAETDADFCARVGTPCGTADALDNCGVARSVLCDSCSEGTWCNTEESACSPCNVDEHCGATCADCDASGLVCHEVALVCGVGQDCTGQPDFTPCQPLLNPDNLDYHFCARGACVTPGCGDVLCNAPGPHFRLPDSGQRTCSDENAWLSCSLVDSEVNCSIVPFCGQDAQTGWDAENAQAARYTRSEPVADEPLVLDNVTGLMWQGCPNGLRQGDCTVVVGAQVFTWSDALASCSDLSWGGWSDWHLPDEYELFSLLKADTYSPAMDAQAFPNTLPDPTENYWSSSTFADDVGISAWYSSSAEGWLLGAAKSEGHRVRCVRTSVETTNTVTQRFDRHTPDQPAEPVVTDTATGFQWQGCVAALEGANCDEGVRANHTWEQALSYCEGLVWAGESDWSLPNIMELWSLVENRQSTSPLNGQLFPAVPAGNFDGLWSSTTRGFEPTEVWHLPLGLGQSSLQLKANNNNPTLCVRSAL